MLVTIVTRLDTLLPQPWLQFGWIAASPWVCRFSFTVGMVLALWVVEDFTCSFGGAGVSMECLGSSPHLVNNYHLCLSLYITLQFKWLLSITILKLNLESLTNSYFFVIEKLNQWGIVFIYWNYACLHRFTTIASLQRKLLSLDWSGC